MAQSNIYIGEVFGAKIPVNTPKSMTVAVFALDWPGLVNPDPGNQR
jgi:hypothetical protein